MIGELASEGLTALGEAGCAASDVTILVGADMRYVGQQHEVTVIFDTDPRQSRDSAALTAQFEDCLSHLYGVNPSHVPIELVTWRVTARGPLPPFDGQAPSADRGRAPKRHRAVHAWEDGQSAPVYERSVARRRPDHRWPGHHRGARDHHRAAARLERDDRRARLHRRHERLKPDASSQPMDGVELEILWSNLIGIVDERAKALQRIAFSPIVREAGDLACALFDRRGRMVAQANTGTPGHINSLAIAGAHLVRLFEGALSSPATC